MKLILQNFMIIHTYLSHSPLAGRDGVGNSDELMVTVAVGCKQAVTDNEDGLQTSSDGW